MRITSIEMRDFMSHKKTKVSLPQAGIVVVSGPNGAGKSSLVEAVSVALWGKPLRSRGTKEKFSPWKGGKGLVTVHTDQVVVSRPEKGRVKWSPLNADPIKYENATKAQHELEKVILSQDVWTKVALFSSNDATQFTRATDAERKRLLEVLLGLDSIDAASVKCRGALRSAEARLAEAQASSARLEFEIKTLDKTIEDLEENKSETFSIRGKTINFSESKEVLQDLRTQIEEFDEREAERAKVERAYKVAVSQVAKLELKLRVKRGTGSASKCPTCGATIKPVKPSTAAIQELTSMLEEAQAGERAAKAAVDSLPPTAASTEAIEKEVALIVRWRKGVQAYRDRYSKLLVELEDKHDLLAEAKSKADSLERECVILRCADKVLGVSGVRSHILEGALAGIENVVNMWLSRLTSTGDFAMSVELSPYKEKSSGGVTDAISFRVLGVANDQGYRGASGGEQKRIDAAFVLALSEITAGASGVSPGTLFFDEAFDSLDEEGQDSVCEVLKELSQDRCIVVITHRNRLRQNLRKNGALWLQVEGGKICRSK